MTTLIPVLLVVLNLCHQTIPSKTPSLTSYRIHRRSPDRLIQSLPLSEADAKFVVNEHNKYRRMVSAVDIWKLNWSPKLASSAQLWADQCIFGHTAMQYRKALNVGENIYTAPYQDLSESVFLWYNERNDPTCGCSNRVQHCCGHFTQLVWASSTEVGCGFSKCSSIQNVFGQQFILVCHYSPKGNVFSSNEAFVAGLSQLAYTNRGPTDPECSGCPVGSKCDDGLCA